MPSNVDPTTHQVTCDDFCEIAMDYVGSDSQGHEFKCATQPGQCPRMPVCPQYRHIEIDFGYFQPIPYATEGISKMIDLRKNGERPFNLLKKRKGLDYARVRGPHNILAQSIFTTVATLLIEMAGTRKSRQSNGQEQLELFAAV